MPIRISILINRNNCIPLNLKNQRKAITLYEKGLKLSNEGKVSQGIKHYREAISLKPDFYQAHNNLGNLYLSQKNLDSAYNAFQKALSFSDENSIILNNIGNTLKQQNKPLKALDYFKRSVKSDPGYINARLNLIVCLFEVGDRAAAFKSIETARESGVSETLLNLFLLQSQYFDDSDETYIQSANALYERLCSIDSNDPIEISSLIKEISIPGSSDCIALTLINFAYAKSIFDLADSLYEKFKATPNCFSKLLSYQLKKELNSSASLSKVIQKLLSLSKSNDTYIKSLLADAYFWDGQLEKSKSTLESLPLDSRDIPSCKQWFAFQEHDFESAWQLYSENIRRTNQIEAHTKVNPSSIRNANILIIGDQGIGDQLMFLSCLGDLMSLNPKSVCLNIDKRLHPLVSRKFPTIIFNEGVNPDITTSLSSIPSIFRNDIESFKNPTPFYTADAQKTLYLKKVLSDFDSSLKIGFAWKGGGVENFRLSSSKSMSIDDFYPLFNIPNTQWFNLQYGDVEPQLENVKELYPNTHFLKEIDPLKEIESQLALISNMDLIIQPSNASIHFSGALGVQSWCLLGHPYDFRWFNNGKDDQSAWYPSVRLIKKHRRQTWQNLTELMRPELLSITNSKKNGL